MNTTYSWDIHAPVKTKRWGVKVTSNSCAREKMTFWQWQQENTALFWPNIRKTKNLQCREAKSNIIFGMGYRPDMSPLVGSPYLDPRFWQTGSRGSSCSVHCGWTSHQRWMRWFQKRKNDCLGPLALQTLEEKKKRVHAISIPWLLLIAKAYLYIAVYN